MKILFFGSCSFAVRHLKALVERASFLRHIEVVTPPDLEARRHVSSLMSPQVPVKTLAQSFGLPVHDAPRKTLKSWTVPKTRSGDVFDVAVVVSFGYFLPKHVLGAFPVGAVNVHPSLLPKYRGPAPIHHTILNGDTTTGVSIIELHEKHFDAGRILKQVSLPNLTTPQLTNILSQIGSNLLIDVLSDLPAHQARAQTQRTAYSHAPKLTSSSAQVFFPSSSSIRIDCQRRALFPSPLFTFFGSQKLFLTSFQSLGVASSEAHLLHLHHCKPGSGWYNEITGTLLIRCVDDWVGVKKVKVDKCRETNVGEWVRSVNFRNGIDQFDVVM